MAAYRRGHRRSPSEISDHFRYINEQEVEDISLEFFYKPHTITLLLIAIVTTFYFAFTNTHEDNSVQNIFNGLKCLAFFFLILSLLAFPNGPFTRPHPALWRIIFGCSVMYLLLLVFVLFQSYTDVRRMMEAAFPDLQQNKYSVLDRQYAVNCSDVSFYRLWQAADWFAFSHFAGWILKAGLMRHYGICWTISIMWELTEVAFIHLLPNFSECWWDSLIMDVLLCNGLGIWVGMKICKKLEITEFHWDSIKNIRTTSGKIRRAVLQFTPASWTHVRWLDPSSSYMRVIAVYILIVFTQIAELNTFFIKHIFLFSPDHPLGVIRICLIVSMSAPTLRQYYTYVTDPRCKRVGTQLWVFTAVTLIEFLICVKFGVDVFSQLIMRNVIIWLVVQLLMVLICLYVAVFFFQRRTQGRSNLPTATLDWLRSTKRWVSEVEESAKIPEGEEVNGGSPANGSTGSGDSSHPYMTRQRVRVSRNREEEPSSSG
ncbi:phosphatidylserine synthase 1-like [Amphiura filiformis]|uniref:phosphatidylserine synthase 1-like n=1 Tax=Amphiura filiformis TaxID=82378 RepID=UPI003B21DA70